MIWSAAIMCASSSTKTTARRKSVTTSASALFTGFGCKTTVSAATTIRTAITRKSSAPMRSAGQHDDHAGHQHVGQRQRQQKLPAEVHHLVVAVAGQRPADQDLEHAQEKHLDGEARDLEQRHEELRQREHVVPREVEA